MLRVPDDEPIDAGLDAPEADAERIDDRRNRLPGLDGITQVDGEVQDAALRRPHPCALGAEQGLGCRRTVPRNHTELTAAVAGAAAVVIARAKKTPESASEAYGTVKTTVKEAPQKASAAIDAATERMRRTSTPESDEESAEAEDATEDE